ncbi:MAG TPA: DNA-directed RNA polymerase subunit beta', partial [Acidimicrobiales bacterium]|nr:DNA-directed RNA polymerase subunit beta' [Acidimicrobiales bacterium]
CGLPKKMALVLFEPFIIRRLKELGYVHTVRSAKKMIERQSPEVWDILEEVTKGHPVLLNRAPTLHRLGIQAFEPQLVEGKAIQIHPLVWTAFNADFDGDQMAVHLPLSAEAQAEARVLMLSSNNILLPANGKPIITPAKDMVLGCYYLTLLDENAKGSGRAFRHIWEVEQAYELGDIDLHAAIEIRIPELRDEAASNGHTAYQKTTAGRLFFNQALPEGFRYINDVVGKKATTVGEIVQELSDGYANAVVAEAVDQIKNNAFRYATQSGVTFSIDDVRTPVEKKGILDRYEKEADKVEQQFKRGIITDGERRQKEVEIWTNATSEVEAAMNKVMSADIFNPIEMMVTSGARGNSLQIRQIAGMRGLVTNPRGDFIPRPIKSNFREGLEMLEYFIATPGARKGLVDTALRTADSGYLTRRLVDVAQELIIREIDCGTNRGVWMDDVNPDQAGRRTYLETRLDGRVLLEPVTLSTGETYDVGYMLMPDDVAALRDDESVDRVRVRSVLTCEAEQGICSLCYGRSLATGGPIELGEAVGVIAAQSIGEPGTQLTMRTFHTGGVSSATGDIAGGLPRVVELFEARSPKGKATLARISGVVRITEDEGRGRTITVVGDDGTEEAYLVPGAARLEVVDGQEIVAGDAIVEGPRDPKELLEIKGVRETQTYLVEQVQRVYRDQGVSIHDKHIELIVRQMTRRVGVQEPGDADFLPGERVDARIYAETNRALVQEGKVPAEGRPELMGITKASLATESWLSAASFQETTRVLTEAAIESKSDSLLGLKENIIIGKLIPAGTGMTKYRNFDVTAPDYEPMQFWTSEDDTDDVAEWLLQQTEAQETNGEVREFPTTADGELS